MWEGLLCLWWFNYPGRLIQAKFGCSTFIVLRRGGERPDERVITVGIGWDLLASATCTSGLTGYIKLAYCSSAKGLQ